MGGKSHKSRSGSMQFWPRKRAKTEVAREIGISRVTIEPIWQGINKQKIITKTKKVGNAELYRLNTKNPIVIKLRELDFVLANKTYVKKKSLISIPA